VRFYQNQISALPITIQLPWVEVMNMDTNRGEKTRTMPPLSKDENNTNIIIFIINAAKLDL
jgi:hypothetical protein